MIRYELMIPGEPVGKGRPRFVKAAGRTYTPEKTARYENLVALAFSEKYPDAVPLEGPVMMMMTAYFSIPKSWSKKKQQQARDGIILPTKKPDTDNISKIKDALNGIAYRDDAQVIHDPVFKMYSDNPRLEIRIKAAEGEEIKKIWRALTECYFSAD